MRMVEDTLILSAEYCFPFWPKLAQWPTLRRGLSAIAELLVLLSDVIAKV